MIGRIEGEKARITTSPFYIRVDRTPETIRTGCVFPSGVVVDGVPHALRLWWHYGRTAHLVRQQTARQQCLIPNHLCIEPLLRTSSQKAIVRISFDKSRTCR